ncbi:MAG: hypothetical protein MAG715_01087 [Methanonatronarchaeales archaeon]|nr:hypothetical protein [Methanonatronarchaeales archaeon]
MEVLGSIEKGRNRFNEIEEDTGLNPNVVNMRLKDLRMAGLVDKKEGRKGYELTPRGKRALELGRELKSI